MSSFGYCQHQCRELEDLLMAARVAVLNYLSDWLKLCACRSNMLVYELCWACFGSVVLVYLARGAESRC